jgi:hypothetical protein
VVGDAGEEAFEAGRDLGLVSAVRRRSKHFQRNDSALVIATWSKAALSSRLPTGLSRCRSGWPDQTGSAAARRAQPYRWLREVARAGDRVDGRDRRVGERRAARLAVGAGPQVMAAMFQEDVTQLCGPGSRQ